MKRHLPGFFVFVLIVGVSVTAFALIRSIPRRFDTGSVPPVVDVRDAPTSDKTEAYRARLVQYVDPTRRLTAPLEVDRDSIGDVSSVAVALVITASETGSREVRMDTVATVLPGQGNTAVVVVDLILPPTVVLRKGENHYIKFRVGSDDRPAGSLNFDDFGKASPIVLVHPSPSVRKGPVILQ
jgi:hypothetical protein